MSPVNTDQYQSQEQAAAFAVPPGDTGLLVAYQIGMLAAAAMVVIDDQYRRSHASIVTNLAVDLRATGVRPLRDVIA